MSSSAAAPATESPISNSIAAAFGLGLAAAAVFGFATSFIPIAFVRARISRFANAGAKWFDDASFGAMTFRARIVAAIILAAAFLVILLRRRLAPVVARVIADFPEFWAEIRNLLAEVFSSPAEGFVLLSTFLVAFVLRLHFLFQPMQFDEGITFIHFASRPVPVAISWYEMPNNHLLHTLLVHFSYSIFGSAPWALRLPAFCAGVLVVPATYFAARVLYDPFVAAFASALAASSSMLVGYSTNARGYSLQTLLFVLALGIAASIIRSRNYAAWFTLGLTAVAALYTIPTTTYAVAILGVWVLISCDPRQIPRAIGPLSAWGALVGILVFCLYAPVLVVTGPHLLFGNQFVQSWPFPFFLRSMGPSLIGIWRAWNIDTGSWFPFFLSGAALIGMFRPSHQQAKVSPALTAIMIVPFMLLMQRALPFIRVWTFLLPLYLITASAGIAFVSAPLRRLAGTKQSLASIGAVVILLLAVSASVVSNASFFRTNSGAGCEELANFLKSQLQPGDRIAANGGGIGSLEYYLYRNGTGVGYTTGDKSGSRRILLVRYNVDALSLNDVFAINELSCPAGRERLLSRSDYATVFEIPGQYCGKAPLIDRRTVDFETR